MGFGRRKSESSCTALQTQLRSEDGRSSRKEKKQSRRAKYFRTHFDKLATGGKRPELKRRRVAFDLLPITLHFPRQ